MTIGISTSSLFLRYDTEDAIIEIARLGVKQLEIFFSGYDEYTSQFMDEACRRVHGEGMACSAVHVLTTQFEPQLFSPHKRQREQALGLFCSVLDGAQALGCTRYVMHGTLNLKRNAGPPNYERTCEYLLPLVGLAAERGVRIALENVHWCMYHFPGYAAGLQTYMNETNLGYTLDIKQAILSGYDPYEYLDEMGDRLCNIHVCGVSGDGPTASTSMPERSGFDIAKLAKRLRAMHYDGPVTLEVYPGDFTDLRELKQSVDYLEQICNG